MQHCPYGGTQISRLDQFCPCCSQRVSRNSISSGKQFIAVIGIVLAIVIAGVIALGVGNTPARQSATANCSLKLTNWVSLPLPPTDYQPGVGGNLPTLSAFANDPTLASWISAEETKFYLTAATRSQAGALAQLQTDTLSKCTALDKRGFEIANIPSAAS